MRLIHYSNRYLTEVRDVEQPDNREGRGDKPSGLWVSVEGKDDWRSWCLSEDFHTTHLACPTEVVLCDGANILRVQGEAELKAFHDQWGINRVYGAPAWEKRYRIRWDDLSRQYDGIIIAPYVWSMRLSNDTLWYYGWDCASGCIWRARAVRELRHLPHVDARTTGEAA